MKRIPGLCLFFIFQVMMLNASSLRTFSINNADGLSNSSVTCIRQGSDNRVWIGTWDGLNVYDGRDIRTYKYSPSDDNTISNNIIRNILEQHPGIIWIATDNGINRIDTGTGHICRLFGQDGMNPAEEGAFKIAEAAGNTVFCAVNRYGLSYYDEDASKMIPLNIPGADVYEVKDICGSGDCLWILDRTGSLFKVSLAGGNEGMEVRNVETPAPGERYSGLFALKNHIAAVDAGLDLWLFDSADGSLSGKIQAGNGKHSGTVTSVAENDTSLFIAFSGSGLGQYLYKTGELTDMDEFSGKSVLSVMSGTQNTLWIGTDGEGVIVRYPWHRNFNVVYGRNISQDMTRPVRCFFKDGHGNLWVGTKGSGIFCLDGNYGSRRHISVSDGLSDNSVYCLAEGPGNTMLIGTDGKGIDICDPLSGKIYPLDISLMEKGGDVFSSVYCLAYDGRTRTLYAGTSGYGLVQMVLESREDGRYKVVEYGNYLNGNGSGKSLGSNIVYSILPDNDWNTLWIGTRGGGLARLDTDSRQLKRFVHNPKSSGSLSSNDILSLAADGNGTLWIGTSYGLNEMAADESGKTYFRRYDETDGLPNNTIHGILPENDILWISSNNGICRFSPGDIRATNYTVRDGLQNNEFSDGAYYKSPDGTFFFGGIAGFNWFSPGSITWRSFTPSIRITDFRISNKSIGNLSGLEDGVILGYDQRTFSISFVALDFINNLNCEYAYMLDGFNKEWVMAGGSYNAVFADIPPGKYTFRVKSTNSDKIWCDNELSFPVRIRYPWWLQWWSCCIYVCLMAALVFTVWRIVRMKIDLSRIILLERMEKQKDKEIHEAKLDFFTNVAHEFCTPLTLIYGPCEKLLENCRLDETSENYIRTIRANATRMQGLIAELMDFRKADTGHIPVRYERLDIPGLLKGIAEDFSEIGSTGGISFSMTADVPEPFTSDRACLEKIFFNLVSNAWKYTPQGGTITVAARLAEDGSLLFRTDNTGKGIKQEDIPLVFDRFRILDNFERQMSKGNMVRNGIGLAMTKDLVTLLHGEISVESEPDGLTSFIVSIPPGQIEEEAGVREEKPGEETCHPPVSCERGGVEDRPVLMIVDDESQILDFIAGLFSDRYNILSARNGLEALETMKHYRPDVILCDIVMPEMDGYEFVSELKGNPYTANIPVVFLTSKSAMDDHIRGYELGVEAYVPKPFHPKHLQALIDRIVLDRQSLKKYYNSPLSRSDLYEGTYIDEDDRNFLIDFTNMAENGFQNGETDLDAIAGAFAMSRIQLYRKVRELTGVSPGEYIRSLKLKRAARLLCTTSLTVLEIMYRSGFNNKSWFFKEFRKEYGCAPKKYRETNAL